MGFLRNGRTIEVAIAVLLTALAIVLVLLRTGGASEPGPAKLSVTTAWARPTVAPGGAGAAYVTILNSGAADRLAGASSPAAERIEIHAHEHEGTVMRMRHLPGGVEIPSGKETVFAPGGMHLMLIGLKAPLAKGESFPLELKFRDAGAITVQVEVSMTPPRGARRGGHQ